ncbi:MAG: hypothetical protein AB7S39_17405 [Gemmatimonadales bacterium]
MRIRIALLVVGGLATPILARAQGWPGRARLEPEQCTAAPAGTASAWLEKARTATGLAAVSGILHWRATDVDVQFYQSDRPYPPFLANDDAGDWWFDPATGAERWDAAGRPMAIVRNERATYAVRDTLRRAMPPMHAFYSPSRALNPLAVLADWREGEVRLAARCTFRGFPRIVLERAGERLYLNERSGVPVKFERIEPHPTWGQVRLEYVYGTWWRSGPVSLPVVSVQYLDGVEHLRRDVRLPQRAAELLVTVVPADSAPSLTTGPEDHRSAPGFEAQVMPVDTVRVDASTVLLRTQAYTHAVTVQRDTVFLLDATTAEWRSRADSALIAALFPKARATVLVVTDLAWPHIGGVRFWAARGATIVTHDLSRPFLSQLLDRRWTLKPDLLETMRRAGRRPPPIRAVGAGLALAGGAVRVLPIDGVASEGALMVAVGGAFLWAGDYIQQVSAPSQYAAEVIDATRRFGIEPERTAAQHLPLTPWQTVRSANPGS